MFCLFACFIIGKKHNVLKESTQLYMSNQTVLIGGKKWFFIRRTSTNKYLFYSYENKSDMFITTFGLFSMNEMGDFVQLSFSDGVDKIETAYNHVPEIVENHLEVKLSNGRSIEIRLSTKFKLFYDNDCSISKIK